MAERTSPCLCKNCNEINCLHQAICISCTPDIAKDIKSTCVPKTKCPTFRVLKISERMKGAMQ